jgi:hypothetical protein
MHVILKIFLYGLIKSIIISTNGFHYIHVYADFAIMHTVIELLNSDQAIVTLTGHGQLVIHGDMVFDPSQSK